MSDREFSHSVHVAREPGELYELVSDVTRMGQWSPTCRACWWDEVGERSDGGKDVASGPQVGAWFTGRNETPERTWETRSQVVAAEPGREFAWEVNNGWVRWGFSFEPAERGTLLTESWTFLPAGIAGFHERYGDKAEAQIAERTESARTGIPATLAAIRATAESA